MGVRGILRRLGCAGAALAVLVGCARHGASANAIKPAITAASQAAAPPTSAPTNTPPQSDLFDINAMDPANAANTVDPAEASLLAEKNADCVDQLIKAQPFGESRAQIIDSVTKACLPIATWALQSSPEPPAKIEASERSFVAGRLHDLVDAPANSASAAPPA